MRLVTEPSRVPGPAGSSRGHSVDINLADSTLPSTVKGILTMGPEVIGR